MLPFILVVFLAGGVGLIAVSAAERPDPATPRRGVRRGEARPRPPRVASAPDRRRRRDRRGGVPRSRTAVEGAFGVIAVASPARRAMSAVTIAVIVVAVAVSIAAAVGVSAVVVGHALDSAIG